MSNQENVNIETHIQQKIVVYIQKHWRMFLTEGIFFIALGIAAILAPYFFTEAFVIFFGWILLAGGVIHVSRSLMFSTMPGFWLWLFIGILEMGAGYLFIAAPLAGLITLTMMMSVFFAFEGLAKISLALVLRPLAHWGLMLFSGVTSLVFALIIVVSLSETANWLLGVLLGINMIFLGWSLIKLSLFHKDES